MKEQEKEKEKEKKRDVDLGKLLLDIKDVAYLLSLSERTLYNSISQRRCPIPVRRCGRSVRFATADVLRYVDSL